MDLINKSDIVFWPYRLILEIKEFLELFYYNYNDESANESIKNINETEIKKIFNTNQKINMNKQNIVNVLNLYNFNAHIDFLKLYVSLSIQYKKKVSFLSNIIDILELILKRIHF